MKIKFVNKILKNVICRVKRNIFLTNLYLNLMAESEYIYIYIYIYAYNIIYYIDEQDEWMNILGMNSPHSNLVLVRREYQT